MSDLEGQAQSTLTAMLDARSQTLGREQQRALAAWTLKTGLMMDQTQSPSDRVIPRREYEHLFRHREPSGQIRIWLTSYAGDTVLGMGRAFGLDADVTRGLDPARGYRDIWGSTITFGSGVLQLFGTTVAPLLSMACGWTARRSTNSDPLSVRRAGDPGPDTTMSDSSRSLMRC